MSWWQGIRQPGVLAALTAVLLFGVGTPLATAIIGGILSSTLLTLLVLPALYRMSYRKQPL